MSNLFYDPGPEATGQKILLATTAYENPAASYTFSIQKSRAALGEAGIQSGYLLLSGNCHVDDARNVVMQEFLLSDCTDLVFLDADVSWDARALVQLCRYDCDLVGGIYPYRRDDDNCQMKMPVRMIEGVHKPGGGLLEVEGLPAGFMRMRRVVPETLAKTAKLFWNRNDRRSKIPILFERTWIDGTRFGGDIEFCRKWRGAGGVVHAAYEMRLGHASRSIIWDSLGASLRRQTRTTLAHVVDRIRAGSDDLTLFTEARRSVGNTFGALEDILALSVIMARKADGPILEIGSGLTTILMAAAAPTQTVYCLESSHECAAYIESMSHNLGLTNIAICKQPIRGGWYDVSDLHSDEFPGRFALALVDGPDRLAAGRMPFFSIYGHSCATIIVDDADDPGYAEAISDWAEGAGRKVDFVDNRAALIRRIDAKERAA